MKKSTKGKKVDVELEAMKQEIISMIQNTTDKVKVSRAYECLTGYATQSHPTNSSQIRVIT
jgi:hypothetical protein